MTHFLARLVERARGTVPGVAPLIAPRFAPVPPPEMPNESALVTAAPTFEAVPGARPSPRRKTTPTAPSEATPPIRASVADSMVTPPPPESPAEMVHEVLLVPPPPLREEKTAQPTPIHPDGSLPLARQVRPSSSRPAMARPAPRSADRRISPNEPARDERPIVRVTIGRIEVRAAPSAATAPRKLSRSAPPKLTLEAYLKERKEGAR